ncbi:hypothetical protein Rs2_44363 [Raphanus sativus]|nr:hypothetical protein Rs2_44363 [Raphanus sativus]
MVFGQARQVKNHLDRGDLDRSGQLGRILNKRRRNLDRAGLDWSQHLGRKGDEERSGSQDRDNATGRFRTGKRGTGIMYPGRRDHWARKKRPVWAGPGWFDQFRPWVVFITY